MKLNNTEQLLIRACKSENYWTRLESVYKRCYTKYPGEFEKNITMILAGLIDDHFPLNISDYIRKRNENEYIFYKDEPEKWKHSVFPLIQHIRFMNTDRLTNAGYRIPRMFR